MLNQNMLQYYCSNCKNILRETDSELNLPHVVEPCPFCGSLLSESLEKRISIQKTNKVIFQTASQVPRLTLDITKLDLTMPFLSLDQKVALVGHGSQKLIERLVVRAQLPHRHGGLDSNVVIIDGGNSSDPYLCINFARQYGLDVKDVLSKIISSRAFTVYQLENLISNELPDIIKKFDAKFVVISDLLGMFVNDPYLDKNDVKRLLDSIVQSISSIRNCLVVVSVSKSTKYDGMIFKSFDRIIHLSNKDGITTIDLDYHNPLTIKTRDMETVFHR